METIDYTNGGKDPKDDSYFTYYLTKDRKSLQLLAFMEDAKSIAFTQQTQAATNYEERYPKTYGKKLGILVSAESSTLNTPAQEISANTTAGYLDTFNASQKYSALLEDDTFTASGYTL